METRFCLNHGFYFSLRYTCFDGSKRYLYLEEGNKNYHNSDTTIDCNFVNSSRGSFSEKHRLR